MPAHSSELLGERIREVRQQRGISVRELARRIGRSPSLVSQIERGVSAPSAGIIYQLATELGTSLDYLFGVEAQPAAAAETELPAAVGDAAVTRRAPGTGRRRPVAALPEATADELVLRSQSRQCLELASGVRWERLSPSKDPYVDFMEVIYQPRGNLDDPHRALRHDGREYGLIVSGSLRANVGFDEYLLEAGDSIVFDSVTPHVYWNPADEMVRAIWMIVHHEPGRA